MKSTNRGTFHYVILSSLPLLKTKYIPQCFVLKCVAVPNNYLFVSYLEIRNRGRPTVAFISPTRTCIRTKNLTFDMLSLFCMDR